MEIVDLNDYYSCGYFLIRADRPDWGAFHGALVVDWQRATSCNNAITLANGTALYHISDFAVTYTEAVSQSILDPVPWIADFTLPVDSSGNGVQNPTPRPFYCTMYQQSSTAFFFAHDWYFFSIPDLVTVPLNSELPDSLYVDPNWQWSSNE